MGDNVFVDIMPGEHYQQVINFPPNHPPGMLWYRPHMDGLVEGQISEGMSGGLIVEGILEPFPQLRGIRERMMLPKDFQNIAAQIPPEGQHVFHIHQLHFQLTEIDGKTLPFIGRQDIVKMPVHSTIKSLLPFTDPVQVGKLVYHCDIVLARRQRHDADHRGSAVTGEPEQPARIGSKDGTKRLRIGLLGCYFPMEDGKERF